MNLVEILLPVCDNKGRKFPAAKYAAVRDKLTRKFGGVTSFMRAPAHGEVKDKASGEVIRDDIVVFEIMTGALDHDWWRAMRQRLEREFEQDEIVVRSTAITRL
jgi:hypothetical protein